MFVKGQKVSGGEHLTAQQRTKIIEMRKAGNKWKDIAAAFDVPVKRAMSWAKRAWYKKGMSKTDAPGTGVTDEGKEKVAAGKITDKEGTPGVEKKTDEKEKEVKTDEVDKTKDKAGKVVSKEIEKHITKSDKAPAGVTQPKGEGKTTDQVDNVAKKGLSVPKSVGMWFILAIVVAIVVIFVVYLLLKPSKLEKGDYNQPTEKKSKPGFENRNIDDL